ncbi:magnesium transporter MgtE N-terminal domain-containing protein [Paenibacillus guangzhouensis]|uniref:magnesium transporter MgtE N-terminal domain-containing protein n=1 Tax=Paenibacillus guangzhouensis TaxID=1473112 RepID=UPI001D10290F|nr:primosomal protein [Paenibacillus guangzhouensis]
MKEADIEKSSYSGFERFLFFVTPIIFTIVLLFVLLALFNFPVRNTILEIAQKIPIVNQFVPEPSSKTAVQGGTDTNAKNDNLEKKIEELNQLLAAKDAELKKSTALIDQKDQEITTLKDNVAQTEQKFEEKKQTDEAYQAQITGLANMYAKMQPSKAAPVMESLTLDEQVLVLQAMKPNDRIKILEKMTPKAAADASILLKDAQPSENLAIAAVQARLNKLKNEEKNKVKDKLDNVQLTQTFRNMTPKSAASLILETAKISEDKALLILKSIDDSTRSQILSAMTENKDTKSNKDTAAIAAKLLSKIMPAK